MSSPGPVTAAQKEQETIGKSANNGSDPQSQTLKDTPQPEGNKSKPDSAAKAAQANERLENDVILNQSSKPETGRPISKAVGTPSRAAPITQAANELRPEMVADKKKRAAPEDEDEFMRDLIARVGVTKAQSLKVTIQEKIKNFTEEAKKAGQGNSKDVIARIAKDVARQLKSDGTVKDIFVRESTAPKNGTAPDAALESFITKEVAQKIGGESLREIAAAAPKEIADKKKEAELLNERKKGAPSVPSSNREGVLVGNTGVNDSKIAADTQKEIADSKEVQFKAEHFSKISEMGSPISNLKGHLDRMTKPQKEALVTFHLTEIEKGIKGLSKEDTILGARLIAGMEISDQESIQFLEREAKRLGAEKGRLESEGLSAESEELKKIKVGQQNFSAGFTDLFARDKGLEKRINEIFESTAASLKKELSGEIALFKELLEKDPSPSKLKELLDKVPEDHYASLLRASRTMLIRGLDVEEIKRVDKLLEDGTRISRKTVEVLAFKRFAEVLTTQRVNAMNEDEWDSSDKVAEAEEKLKTLASAADQLFGADSPITNHIQATAKRTEYERRALAAGPAIYLAKRRQVFLEGTSAGDDNAQHFKKEYQDLEDIFGHYEKFKELVDKHAKEASDETIDLKARVMRITDKLYAEMVTDWVCDDENVLNLLRECTPLERSLIKTDFLFRYNKESFWGRLEAGLSTENYKEAMRLLDTRGNTFGEGKSFSSKALSEIFIAENRLVVTDALLSPNKADVVAVQLNDAITTSADPTLAALEIIRNSGVKPKDQRAAHKRIFNQDAVDVLRDGKGREILNQVLESGKVEFDKLTNYLNLRAKEFGARLGKLEGAESQDQKQVDLLRNDYAEAQKLSTWITTQSKDLDQKLEQVFGEARNQSRAEVAKGIFEEIGVKIGLAKYFSLDLKLGAQGKSEEAALEERAKAYRESQKEMLDTQPEISQNLQEDFEKAEVEGKTIGQRITDNQKKFSNAVWGWGTKEDKAFEGLKNSSSIEQRWFEKAHQAYHGESVSESITRDFYGVERDKANAIVQRDTVAEAAASSEIAISSDEEKKVELAVSTLKDDTQRARFDLLYKDLYAGGHHHTHVVDTGRGSMVVQGRACTDFADVLSIRCNSDEQKAILALRDGDQVGADAAHISGALRAKVGVGTQLFEMKKEDGHLDLKRIHAAVDRLNQDKNSSPIGERIEALTNRKEKAIVNNLIDKKLSPEDAELNATVHRLHIALNVDGWFNGDHTLVREILRAPAEVIQRYDILWKKGENQSAAEESEFKELSSQIAHWKERNAKLSERYKEITGSELLSDLRAKLNSHNCEVTDQLRKEARLSISWQLWDSMEGLGTGTAPGKIMSGISVERAEELKADFRSKGWGSLEKDWIDCDSSGNEHWDAMFALEGESKDGVREARRMERRSDHEKNGLLVSSGWIAADDVERMDHDLANLVNAVASGNERETELCLSRMKASADSVRETVDSTVETIQNTGTTVIVIGGSVIVIVGSGGTATPGLMAMAAASTKIAVAAGGYRIIVGELGKGEGYGREDYGTEVVKTGIDAGSGLAGIGVAKVIPAGKIVGDGFVNLVGRRGAVSSVVILSEESAEVAASQLTTRLVQNSRVLRMASGSIQGAADGVVFAPIDAAGRTALDKETWQNGIGEGLKLMAGNAVASLPEGLAYGTAFGALGGVRTPADIKAARVMSEGEVSRIKSSQKPSEKLSPEGLQLIAKREASQGFVTNGDAADAKLISTKLSEVESQNLISHLEKQVSKRPDAADIKATERHIELTNQLDSMKASLKENGALTKLDQAIVHGERNNPGFAIITEKEIKARIKSGEEGIEALQKKLKSASPSEAIEVQLEIDQLKEKNQALSDQLKNYQEGIEQANKVKELIVYEEPSEKAKVEPEKEVAKPERTESLEPIDSRKPARIEALNNPPESPSQPRPSDNFDLNAEKKRLNDLGSRIDELKADPGYQAWLEGQQVKKPVEIEVPNNPPKSISQPHDASPPDLVRPVKKGEGSTTDQIFSLRDDIERLKSIIGDSANFDGYKAWLEKQLANKLEKVEALWKKLNPTEFGTRAKTAEEFDISATVDRIDAKFKELSDRLAKLDRKRGIDTSANKPHGHGPDGSVKADRVDAKLREMIDPVLAEPAHDIPDTDFAVPNYRGDSPGPSPRQQQLESSSVQYQQDIGDPSGSFQPELAPQRKPSRNSRTEVMDREPIELIRHRVDEDGNQFIDVVDRSPATAVKPKEKEVITLELEEPKTSIDDLVNATPDRDYSPEARAKEQDKALLDTMLDNAASPESTTQSIDNLQRDLLHTTQAKDQLDTKIESLRSSLDAEPDFFQRVIKQTEISQAEFELNTIEARIAETRAKLHELDPVNAPKPRGEVSPKQPGGDGTTLYEPSPEVRRRQIEAHNNNELPVTDRAVSPSEVEDILFGRREATAPPKELADTNLSEADLAEIADLNERIRALNVERREIRRRVDEGIASSDEVMRLGEIDIEKSDLYREVRSLKASNENAPEGSKHSEVAESGSSSEFTEYKEWSPESDGADDTLDDFTPGSGGENGGNTAVMEPPKATETKPKSETKKAKTEAKPEEKSETKQQEKVSAPKQEEAKPKLEEKTVAKESTEAKTEKPKTEQVTKAKPQPEEKPEVKAKPSEDPKPLTSLKPKVEPKPTVEPKPAPQVEPQRVARVATNTEVRPVVEPQVEYRTRTRTETTTRVQLRPATSPDPLAYPKPFPHPQPRPQPQAQPHPQPHPQPVETTKRARPTRRSEIDWPEPGPVRPSHLERKREPYLYAPVFGGWDTRNQLMEGIPICHNMFHVRPSTMMVNKGRCPSCGCR